MTDLPTPPPHGRRNVAALVASNLLGGVGVASGAAVGALLAEHLGGTAMGGLAQSASVLGAAVAAVPLAAVAARRGRRLALTCGYALATAGALLIIGAAVLRQPLLFLGAMALYGVAIAANLQSRYAAADNASGVTRGRTMAIVVWATTVGSVAGPNLAAPGASLGRLMGVPALSGPYVFSVAGYLLAGLVISLLYREPGPTSVVPGEPGGPAAGVRKGSATAFGALAWAWTHGRVRFAVVAMAVAHAVMIMVMVMTPLHMQHGGMSLQLVGIVISLHVLGMFALSPVFGWLADRWGAVRTASLGMALQAVAVTVGFVAAMLAGAGHTDHGGSGPVASVVTAVALVLLGLGWSASVIATSALLAAVEEERVRVPLQGACDALMNYAGAGAAALAGPMLALGGFRAVNVAGAILLIPAVIALVTRSRARSSTLATR